MKHVIREVTVMMVLSVRTILISVPAVNSNVSLAMSTDVAHTVRQENVGMVIWMQMDLIILLIRLMMKNVMTVTGITVTDVLHRVE